MKTSDLVLGMPWLNVIDIENDSVLASFPLKDVLRVERETDYLFIDLTPDGPYVKPYYVLEYDSDLNDDNVVVAVCSEVL